MGNLVNALQQLRAERREAQSHVEKLDQAISLLASLNGSGPSRQANQPTGITSAPTRIISAASRRKMAQAEHCIIDVRAESILDCIEVCSMTVSSDLYPIPNAGRRNLP